jgi:hypothetical protein
MIIGAQHPLTMNQNRLREINILHGLAPRRQSDFPATHLCRTYVECQDTQLEICPLEIKVESNLS